MKIAIYARKSRMTEKGESIENQISLCKQYATIHFPGALFEEYKDEGYSGSNTNRPGFKAFVENIPQKNYDVLICYRLDRISRNVLDFSATLELLANHQIAFVSIKENFDTTTPMGRAMLHISSVFAQLERETIAERIRDNMLELAKTGRWLGGNTPLGYSTEKVKNYTVLKLDFCTKSIVELIFHKYRELGSLSQLEIYLIQNKLRTQNNKCYHLYVLRNMLSNPVYVAADQAVYQYFSNLGAHIATPKESFTGVYGIMAYNKNRKGKTQYKNDITEWIIAIGQHRPIISSQLWLDVQQQLDENSHKAISHHQSTHALLNGLIYCKCCGASMCVTNQSMLKDGTISYIYRCKNKLKSRSKLCSVANIKGHYLDTYVINYVKDMIANKDNILSKLCVESIKTCLKQIDENKDSALLEEALEKNKKATAQLVRLITSCEEELIKVYEEQLKSLYNEQCMLKEKLSSLKSDIKLDGLYIQNINNTLSALQNWSKRIDEASPSEIKTLFQSIIQTIIWDGDQIHIYFYQSKQEFEKNNRNFTYGRKISYKEQ